MNKTYLIASGAGISAVSLAVGAVGGYYYAKKRFETQLLKQFELELEKEVKRTKKYYENLIERQNAPVSFLEDDEKAAEPEEIEEEPDPKVEEAAKVALTNYQGFAEKPPLEVIAKNVFTDTAKPKKKMPPRDPETGLFVAKPKADFADRPRTPVVQEKREPTPYLITQEQFLANDPEHEQENCLYFVNDKTVLQVYGQEVIEIDRIGEVNLTLFPEESEGVERIICVRNEGLGFDYEILLTEESLTEHLGLSED